MESLPALFSDLALILVTAGITTVIFKWLKQPLVLGYIIAGILIGPYFPWFPVVGDHESVETWSEIGMVFLLFAIGLEFSFKKLKKQAGTVGITALTELVSMCVIGFLLGKLLGWSQMDCIFLGAMLSMSSTTIIAKAFEDLKMKGEKFTGSVIGVLVVEDLAAILMMVILSTLAVSTTLNGSELLYSVIKLVFFLLVWYVGGVFIIPTILKWTRKFMSEETLTVFAVGLCFSMVWLANKAGFSSALGAFIMGSILAETLEAEMIHKLTTPIKNLFGALFFVSVGMMVNPVILVQYWWQVLIITVVVVVLKSLSSGIGMLFSGDNLRNSVRAGMCFGQIGEFSFIIATVGISFGVIDNFMYPIIVSVSIITTFLTPYLIKGGDPLYHWIESKAPGRFVEYLENKDKKIKKKNGKWVTFRSFIIGHFKSIVIYSFLVFALMLICFSLLSLLIGHTSIPMSIAVLISLAVTLVVISPLIWALGYKRELERDTIDSIMKKERSRRIVRFVYILRFILAWFFAFLVIRHYLDDKFWQSVGIQMNSIIMATVAALAYMLLMRGISPAMKWYERIEARFLDNFNKRQAQHSFILPTVLQDNFTMEKMRVSPKSDYIGKSIRHCDFYSAYNVTIVCVERADDFYDLPRRDFVLFPSDIITCLGTEEELGKLRPFVEVEDEVLVRERPESEMEIHYSVVSEGSNYLGVSLHDTDLRNRYNALVIAVERDDEFILNPPPSVVFQKDDTVWFVATEAKAEALLKEAYVNEQ